VQRYAFYKKRSPRAFPININGSTSKEKTMKTKCNILIFNSLLA
jgi:hypothetical protein